MAASSVGTNERTDGMATLAIFRELAGRIRAHFKSGNASDFTDRALLQFSAAPLPKGCTVLRGALNYQQQLHWARKATEEYAFYPHNNISALGQALSREAHLKKVRWSCLGMNYDWTNRTYVEGWKSEFPADLAALCVEFVHLGGFKEEYVSEAAIVNFYSPAQMMGPHRDDAELTMKKPIVSMSIGCDAVFCIENKPFAHDSEVACVWVRSGDVVIMGDESREALHGVAVTIPGSFRAEPPVNKAEAGLIRTLSNMRININVRQVEDFADPAATFAGRSRLAVANEEQQEPKRVRQASYVPSMSFTDSHPDGENTSTISS